MANVTNKRDWSWLLFEVDCGVETIAVQEYTPYYAALAAHSQTDEPIKQVRVICSVEKGDGGSCDACNESPIG